MKSSETSWTKFAVEKLAAVASQPVELIERISFKYSGSHEGVTLGLLGIPLNIQDINLTFARHCPACVAEKGFIEAHWHIRYMVGCSIHKQAALWFCSSCKKRVPWLRMGLQTCKCGASLHYLSKYEFSEEDWCLLDLIRGKALGDHTLGTVTPRMPADELGSLSLAQLLSLVEIIGHTRLNAGGGRANHFDQLLLKAAARVFTDWPANFHRLMNDIDPQGPSVTSFDLRKDFASIYQTVLLRNRRKYKRLEQ